MFISCTQDFSVQGRTGNPAESLRNYPAAAKIAGSRAAIRRRKSSAIAVFVGGLLALFFSAASAQSAGSEQTPPASPLAAPAQPAITAPTIAAPQHDWSQALFFDVAASFVPYANDVPVMVGIGVRIAGIHEIWARFGYIPTGDDIGHAFGVGGYRVALRPHKLVRPLLGALFAGLPATCGHDDQGNPACTQNPLFIIAATVGVRLEPRPWLGIFSILTLGTDTYPNPFGMIELGASFALPLR